ncbi:MAG: hypothetical protein GY714_09650 [Desulfobacterales bacterium]|nr:hypothetical protein [Desulfobacterales bacterium]
MKKILILIILSLNFFGCLAYNSIDYELDKTQSKEILKSLIDEDYIEEKGININIKNFKCPQLIDGNNIEKTTPNVMMLSGFIGFPYVGTYHKGYADLYYNRKKSNNRIAKIKCDCKTFKLASYPLFGGFLWSFMTPGDYDYDNDDAIDMFLDIYPSLPLKNRYEFYEDKEDFFKMEIIPNVYEKPDIVISFLVKNDKKHQIYMLKKHFKKIKSDISNDLYKKTLLVDSILFSYITGNTNANIAAPDTESAL